MIILYFIIFILGLAIGSFLNVVIFRLENGEKMINDRSKCMNCKQVLAWYDLFPVLSFLLLRGRCRYCGNRISRQYLLVELGTGILFILIFNFSAQGGPVLGWQFLLSIPYLLFIASSLIVIFVYDLRHYIIPDKIIYPAVIVSFIYKFFGILDFSHLNLFGILNSVLYLLFPAFLAGGFFLAIVLLTRGKGMGGGDVKLGFLMGLILGWPLVLISLFLSFILGSIAGILLILSGKKKMKSMVPFGPFLVCGTFIGIFLGKEIMKWYLDMIIY